MESERRNDLAGVWQGQNVPRNEITLDELRRRSRKLESGIRWRNVREYAASALVIAIFGYYVWAIPSLLARLGGVLTIAGVLFVVYSLHARGAVAEPPADAAAGACLTFYRERLERQRDLLRGVWRWYLLPLVPGLAVFLAGLLEWALALPHAAGRRDAILAVFALVAALCAAGFLAVGKLNRRAARTLEREIAALDAPEQEA